MSNTQQLINEKLGDMLATLPDLPERLPCRCGCEDKPDISFDFDARTWVVFCYGCNASSDKFSYPDLAIEDFNQRFGVLEFCPIF